MRHTRACMCVHPRNQGSQPHAYIPCPCKAPAPALALGKRQPEAPWNEHQRPRRAGLGGTLLLEQRAVGIKLSITTSK